MKRLLLALLLLGLIPSANAAIIYFIADTGFNIESKCKDGKAVHQIWYMDIIGTVKKQNLSGHGDKYFKNPDLNSSFTYKDSDGNLCTQRNLTKEEVEAFYKKFD
tara:strand:+ start:250 stop:564 length:315 start_codon:yes stop_codon:yes gene_type:complete